MAGPLITRGSAVLSGCRRRLASLPAALVAAVIAACIMVGGLEGWHAWESRSAMIEADKIELANLARSLAQHVHDLVQAADVVLIHMRELVLLDGLTPDGRERSNRRMLQTIETMPMIHGLFVYDANGNWRVNSVSSAPSSLNNSDRDYFIYLRDHDEDRLYLGRPIRSRSDGRLIVTVARRINASGGGFGGVVLVTISIDALSQFYATFDVGKSGVITLLSADGVVMAREPSIDSLVGTDLSASEVFSSFLPKSPVGTFSATYQSDGLTRIGSYRRIVGYPLVMVVSHGLDDVLLPWRSDVIRHLSISLAMIVSLAMVGLRLASQMNRTQRADRRYRLLAEHAGDVILCVGLDGRRLYLSPAFSKLTGWSLEDGLTQPWQAFVHPEDCGRILDIGSRLRNGAGSETCRLRYICKGGEQRWAEARVQLLDDGVEPQFVANLRDITDRKRAEDEVEALHHKLATQAITDALTGLANRRRFDEVLEQEWRRAAREGRELSLMVIDVDHFKRYNDRYGHQRGDQCLRDVAAAVAACGRRAGDLAARYGGEEFVILLPGADALDATALAEGVRAAIQAIGIEHADNPPGHVITASVGVATMTPILGADGTQPEHLFAAADAALYEAKQSGRNRVVARKTLRVSFANTPFCET